MTRPTRRDFLHRGLSLGAAALAAGPLARTLLAADRSGDGIAFGLVTYLWGKDWDVPTLIRHCTAAKVLGVELRTQHAHKVEPSLGPAERAEVKKRFADSPVKLVGLGTNEAFHYADPKAVQRAIETAKAYIKLGHDVGATGVKVKPNDLPKDVPQEKTIEQIGRSLNVLGAFGADFGQQIRLEVHGSCSPLPIMKRIMDVADHPNVGVCWNSNGTDLQGGLEANFNLVKNRFGATVHIRRLDSRDYPYADLLRLFVGIDYRGWLMLEGHDVPKDPVPALAQQRALFDKMLAQARGA